MTCKLISNHSGVTLATDMCLTVFI